VKKYGNGNENFPLSLRKLADAFEAHGVQVDRPSKVVPAIQEAIEAPKPVIIDFRVASEENVFPMVPVRAALNEIIDQKSRSV
jgi:acetolactate synthase-1/2/3 large subunit